MRSARLIILIVGLATASAHAQRVTIAPSGWQWSNARIEGMGFVTAVVQHPTSGDIYLKTDVGGIYRYDRLRDRWIAMMDALPLSERESYDIESIALAPSDPTRVAILTQRDSNIPTGGGGDHTYGDVMLTTDGGATWTPQGLLPLSIRVAGNGEYRGFSGERLAIDPRKPDRFVLASRIDGVRLKESASSPWTTASGNPAVTPWVNPNNPSDTDYQRNTPGHTFVLFDPASPALPDGSTSRLYMGDHATGVWTSNTAGRIWSPLPGSPIHPVHATLHLDGRLYVSTLRQQTGPDAALPSVGGVYRFDPATSTWADITPPDPFNLSVRGYRGYTGLAPHPTDPQKLVVMPEGGGRMFRTADAGDTWTILQPASIANQPPYFPPPTPDNYFATSNDWGTVGVVIDRSNPDRLFQTNGWGVISTSDLWAPAPSWRWVMRDLEELVFHNVVAPPVPFDQGGAEFLTACMDMVGLRHERYTQVPTVKAAIPVQIGQANAIAYSFQSPQHAAVVGWDTWRPWQALTGYTSDNGRTWTPFANVTPGVGGGLAMAATNPQNMIWEPASWKPLYYTTDAGQTWTVARNLDAVFDPTNTDPDYAQNWWKVGWAWHTSNPWWQNEHLAADKVQPATFYRFTWGRFMRSTDGGANWTEGFSSWALGSQAPGAFSILTRLVPHPIRPGEVWISQVPNNDETPRPLFRTTDLGATVAPIASIAYATHVAFGRSSNPAIPAIYMIGVPAGGTAADEGVYRSLDDGESWTLLSDPAVNRFAKAAALEADMRFPGRVYIATSGRGLFVGNGCPANCDNSSDPALSPADFSCFLARYRAADPYADCDASGTFSAADFTCFLARFRSGCQ